MNYGNSFYEFCVRYGVGKIIFDSKNQAYKYEFSQKDIEFMKSLDMVFDGGAGGLVLGNLHKEGGVHVLKTYDNNITFYYELEMEGWEYLTSSHLKDDELYAIGQLNDVFKDYNKNLIIEYDIPENCKTIDTRGIKIPIIIIDEYRRFIVNRLSTKNYIDLIMNIDNKYKQ